MSLVAYGSSDEESEEEISPELEHRSSNISGSVTNVAAKKQRESVKITIPSLKEFEDEEKEEVPKKKPKFQSGSGSGLFSLLPPPKNSSTLSKPGFVPYILCKKEQKSSSQVIKRDTSIIEKNGISTTSSSESIEQQGSDEDISNATVNKTEDESTSSSSTDFFSLDAMSEKVSNCSYGSSNYLRTDNPPVLLQDKLFAVKQSSDSSLISASASIDPTSIQEEIGGSSYFEQHQEASLSGTNGIADPEYSDEPNPTDSLLKDKEFLKLQGRRREFEGIDIIDVNAADQLSDRNEWLMKSLTEETTHRPSRKKHSMPTSQQKRKHQITYLAFQAKERELDLKNQWSLNSRTRRETQAKYGF